MIRFGESERGGSRLASEVRESSVVLNHVWAQSGGPVASLRELGAAIYGVIDGGRPQVRLWVGWSGREWRDGGKLNIYNNMKIQKYTVTTFNNNK